jgi:hypothetical protein
MTSKISNGLAGIRRFETSVGLSQTTVTLATSQATARFAALNLALFKNVAASFDASYFTTLFQPILLRLSLSAIGLDRIFFVITTISAISHRFHTAT